MNEDTNNMLWAIQERLNSNTWDHDIARKVVACRQKRRRIATLTLLPIAALLLTLTLLLPSSMLPPNETEQVIHLQVGEGAEYFLAEFSEELLQDDPHIDAILDEMLLANF